jgi:hypothetical protein
MYSCTGETPMSFEGLSSWLQHLAGRQAHFPHQMSFILELPLRRLLISPSQLGDRLHLKKDSNFRFGDPHDFGHNGALDES